MKENGKKEIILVTAGMSGGGTERVIAVLANYMAEKDYEVKIVMTARDEIAYELHSSVQAFSIGSSTGGSPVKRIKRILDLRKIFRQDMEQVIVSFGTETNLFSLLACIGLKNKIIVSERNDPDKCSYKALRNIIYRMADRLVFQTEDAGKCFPKAISYKGCVIPNPLAGEMIRSFNGERSKDIVAVGRLEEQKNHKLLIKAFKYFLEAYPEYRLVLYGKGHLEEELKNLAIEMQIEDKVIFAGFVSNVQEKIQNAAMYVLSSDYEGISNSLMEAMALGLPVISTDCPIGGSAMLIRNEENGLLVPVGDEKALAAGMEYMAENPKRSEEMGRKAEYVRVEYSAGSVCERWMKEIFC
ncbi:MAG: glycosyltransferase family 4 protein [Butyrivibrio sp.]|nr:glycosyltransferase family 4 protein [Butyrivibrio sp.]